MDTSLATSSDPGSVDRRPARIRIYEQLRSELLSAVFSPFHRFTEENVAERFVVSRTPVRDALARLEADGLLIKRDGALFRYTPTLEEFTDLYELRILLEVQGIDRALNDPTVHHDRERITAEQLVWTTRLEQGVAPDAGFVDADEQFHIALLRAAGNLELVSALERVNRRIRPIRMHDYLTQDRVDATISEHLEILELVLTGRLSEARDFLRTHVGQSQSIVEARAARAMQISHMTPGLDPHL
ncbi:GntR family transcriptional regulator [Microbacterium sp. YMB-B2]|uniref:GntR family transcriptional regulator n=1 Tax=Microbacterium tenebrionis TaxID=2830665 RepID=A0A9X1LMD3_9MICO|nr:GntR family transcriptional regulator [Microbacterium tenebrionis]MCC2028296.1 GntR family transcriptional regulator [Microbacterium tenebrionis]